MHLIMPEPPAVDIQRNIMANRYEELIDSFGSDENDSTQTTQTPDVNANTGDSNPDESRPSETQSTDTQPNVNPEDSNPASESPDQTSEQNSSDHQEPSNQGEGNRPKGKRQYTHEEQVQYSFAKLNSKLSSTKRELANALKQIEELKKANAPKPQKLGPDDFGSNEDYLKYIANQSLIEQLQKAAEAKKASETEAKASQEFTNRYNQRASELFSKPEDIEAYNNIVGEAMNNGLNDTLNSDSVIVDFIRSSDWAPRLVFHFAAIPEDLERIAAIKDPTDKRFALNMLQQRIATVFGQQRNTPAVETPKNQTQTHTEPSQSSPAVPIVGKAGTGSSSGGSNPEVTVDEALTRIRRGY